MSNDTNVNRRDVFAVGAGLLALAGLSAGSANAAEPPLSPEEQANVKAIADLFALFAKKESTPAQAAAYVTDDCVLRIQKGKPPVVGKDAAMNIFGESLGGKLLVDIKVLKVFAKGPIVANYRTDTLLIPDKPPRTIPLAAVFIMKDGKIAEWFEYGVQG